MWLDWIGVSFLGELVVSGLFLLMSIEGLVLCTERARRLESLEASPLFWTTGFMMLSNRVDSVYMDILEIFLVKTPPF